MTISLLLTVIDLSIRRGGIRTPRGGDRLVKSQTAFFPLYGLIARLARVDQKQ